MAKKFFAVLIIFSIFFTNASSLFASGPPGFNRLRKFSPTADAILRQYYNAYVTPPGPFFGDTNYGKGDILLLGNNGRGSFTRPIVKFNLSSIPDNAIITEAILKMAVKPAGSTSPATRIPIGVHRAVSTNGEWLESNVTWNNITVMFPPYDTKNISLTNDQYQTWRVTQLVKDWAGAERRYANDGLVLDIGQTEERIVPYKITFQSREAHGRLVVGDRRYPPLLPIIQIAYRVPEPTLYVNPNIFNFLITPSPTAPASPAPQYLTLPSVTPTPIVPTFMTKPSTTPIKSEPTPTPIQSGPTIQIKIPYIPKIILTSTPTPKLYQKFVKGISTTFQTAKKKSGFSILFENIQNLFSRIFRSRSVPSAAKVRIQQKLIVPTSAPISPSPFESIPSPIPTALQVAPTSIPASPTAVPTSAPLAPDAQSFLEAAFESGSVTELSTVMADQVGVGIFATECCGPESQSQAQEFIAGFMRSHPGPYIHERTNSIIDNILSRSEFAGAIVFMSSDNSLLVFRLGADSRISSVFRYGTYREITD